MSLYATSNTGGDLRDVKAREREERALVVTVTRDHRHIRDLVLQDEVLWRSREEFAINPGYIESVSIARKGSDMYRSYEAMQEQGLGRRRSSVILRSVEAG